MPRQPPTRLLAGLQSDIRSFQQDQGMVREAGARTKSALVEVLGEALSAVSGRDAQGYFKYPGYRSVGQLL